MVQEEDRIVQKQAGQIPSTNTHFRREIISSARRLWIEFLAGIGRAFLFGLFPWSFVNLHQLKT